MFKYLRIKLSFFAIFWTLIALGSASQGYASVYAYVSNSFDNTVSVIRTSDNEVIANVAVGEWPYGVAISPDGEYVYVTNTGDDTVSVIRTCDHTVTATIGVGPSPGGVFVSPDGSYVYTANNDDNTVSVIDTSNNTVIASVDVGLWPEGLVATPDGENLYVVNTGDGTLSVIRTLDLTVKATVEVGEWPYGVAVSPSGEHVYVSNTLENTVSVIRTADNTVIDTIKVGFRPIGIELTPDGNYLYVAESREGSVSVIRTLDNTVTATAEVGGSEKFAADPPVHLESVTRRRKRRVIVAARGIGLGQFDRRIQHFPFPARKTVPAGFVPRPGHGPSNRLTDGKVRKGIRLNPSCAPLIDRHCRCGRVCRIPDGRYRRGSRRLRESAAGTGGRNTGACCDALPPDRHTIRPPD